MSKLSDNVISFQSFANVQVQRTTSRHAQRRRKTNKGGGGRERARESVGEASRTRILY